MSAEAAVKLIPAGRRILVGSGAAEPASLVNAMVEHARHLADNPIVHLLTLGPAPYVRRGEEARFRHTAFFIGPNTREAVREGRADFMPVFLSEIPELIRNGRVGVDVALIQVSPPDAHGYVSLGVSVDIVRAAVDTASLILAEVNPRMPVTLGHSFIHVRQIAALIPVDAALPELQAEPLDNVTREIGRQVATLVQDGSTLQLGIGRIPDAVLAALGNRNDLGIHTEMFSDGVMRLADAGVITGRRKSLLPGKMVTSFLMGTRALYEWANEHPALSMHPSDFTNDPKVIASNDHMVAINSALAVDLTGQVASDSVGGSFFSGIGGQVDFIRGSARSRNGKAIIALPSTAKHGTVSRIQATLEPGAGVVTSRGDVHYVVTEYGIADLWGKSVRERAAALIAIAHPNFRADLLAAAKERRYVFADYPVPRGSYPWAEDRREALPDGTRLWVRPMRLTDETGLQELLYRSSEETVYRRFMCHRRVHPHEEVMGLVDLNYSDNMGLVVQLDGSDTLIASARYDVDPQSGLAELAFIVEDKWQGRGIGTMLMRRMVEIARARGIPGFRMDVLAANKQMLSLAYTSGLEVSGSESGGVYRLTARLPSSAPVSPG